VLSSTIPVAEVHEQDTAVILYTSGTTGRPKGAMLTHLGIVHSSMHYALAMGLGPQDATVAAVPLSHVTGLVALTTTFVYCAGKMVIMPAFKAADYLRIAGAERISHSLMVPAMYKLCLIDPSFEQYDLSAWRIGAYGGAPMPVATIVELADKVPELVLMNCYGATETTSPATLMPPGQTRAHNDTVGQPLHCVDMRVMDDEGRELPPGTLGEIWIKGPMVVRGYWDNPEATQANITGGYWHSGDLGTIDAQGYVRVMDRKKDMINRGGFKIYTIEVENALYEHPGVQECAVVAKPCPVLGERVHAFVGLKPGYAATEVLQAELKAHCKAVLSDYKVPESYTVQTTALPRNANGKLLKREMRDQVAHLSPVLDKRA
jgi:O-succinylbenzoic acid--CoA ligase